MALAWSMSRAITRPAALGWLRRIRVNRCWACSSTCWPMQLVSARRMARRRLRARQLSLCSVDNGETSRSGRPGWLCSTSPSWKRNSRGRTSPAAISSLGSTQRSGWICSTTWPFWTTRTRRAAQKPRLSARKGVPVSPSRSRHPAVNSWKVWPQAAADGSSGSRPR